MYSYTVLCSVLVFFSFERFLVDGQNGNGLFRLNVVHYNDFHARFVETSVNSTPCSNFTADGGDACIGGFARLFSAVMEKMAASPGSLLLNAGDTFQGTLWYNILGWNVTQYFINMLPHDAHVLGNHEFDNSIKGAVPYMENLIAPVVVANIDDSEEPTFQKKYKKSVVVERDGRKIGIIGVIISETAILAKTGRLKFLNEVDSINAEAERLTAQDVNIIIVLSHCGLELDREIARKIGPNIHLIVGGHSHTLLYTGDAPSGDKPGGSYPVVVINEQSGNPVLIVQASAFTRYLGEISLYFDEAGVLKRWEGEPLYLANSIGEDQRILNLLAPLKKEIDEIGKRKLGTTRVDLNKAECGFEECTLGSFICDAFIDASVQKAPEGSWTSASICMTNQGGIRGPIERGSITLEKLIVTSPFENTVDEFDLKGKYLLEALEHSLAQTWENPSGGFFGGRMLQVSGIKGTYNISNEVGKRVVELLVRCADCPIPHYELIDMEKNYRVVSQSFLRNGGDAFSMIKDNFENLKVGDVDINILQSYVSRQSPIMQWLDGRIIVHDPKRMNL